MLGNVVWKQDFFFYSKLKSQNTKPTTSSQGEGLLKSKDRGCWEETCQQEGLWVRLCSGLCCLDQVRWKCYPTELTAVLSGGDHSEKTPTASGTTVRSVWHGHQNRIAIEGPPHCVTNCILSGLPQRTWVRLSRPTLYCYSTQLAFFAPQAYTGHSLNRTLPLIWA